MPAIAFDPGAERRLYDRTEALELALVEALLERLDDGRLVLTLQDEDGEELESVVLRADFFDQVSARTAELHGERAA